MTTITRTLEMYGKTVTSTVTADTPEQAWETWLKLNPGYAVIPAAVGIGTVHPCATSAANISKPLEN